MKIQIISKNKLNLMFKETILILWLTTFDKLYIIIYNNKIIIEFVKNNDFAF